MIINKGCPDADQAPGWCNDKGAGGLRDQRKEPAPGEPGRAVRFGKCRDLSVLRWFAVCINKKAAPKDRLKLPLAVRATIRRDQSVRRPAPAEPHGAAFAAAALLVLLPAFGAYACAGTSIRLPFLAAQDRLHCLQNAVPAGNDAGYRNHQGSRRTRLNANVDADSEDRHIQACE
jgi:hypothetical protein